MNFNFVVDRLVKGRAYPALATWSAEPYTPAWQEFVGHWPYTVPCELINHCQTHNYPHTIYTIDQEYPANSYYPIGIGWFDFEIDYFSLLPHTVIRAVQQNHLRILFYYHEGDNPYYIQHRLDALCQQWNLPENAYLFISGNTAARRMANFAYFQDHELLYWRQNQSTAPLPINTQPRNRDFTCLSRTHKWWRAAVMADLKRNGLLNNSFWSYRTDITINDSPEMNPIEIDQLNLRYYMEEFVKSAPYVCDNLTPADHNDHAQTVTQHYTDSYCNIVLETLYDADQSSGTFLTEKIFKPIKHAQPFIIIGPAGTTHNLKYMGYRVFESVIDHSYDSEPNNTRRWQLAFQEIARIKKEFSPAWIERCRADLEHNQQLFASNKRNSLNTLLLAMKAR